MASQATNDTGLDRVFTIVNYAVLALFLVTVTYPLIYVVSATDGSARKVAVAD